MEIKDYKNQIESLKEKFGNKQSAMFIGKKIVEKIGNESDFIYLTMDEFFQKANDVISDMHKELNANDNVKNNKK